MVLERWSCASEAEDGFGGEEGWPSELLDLC